MTGAAQGIPISSLLEVEALCLEFIAGRKGAERSITSTEVQKPGLALAGHLESLHAERVQMLGYSECSFIETLAPELAQKRLEDFCRCPIPCVIVTRDLAPPAFLQAICDDLSVPLLRTPLTSGGFMGHLRSLLSAQLSPSSSIHGVLVDVFGIGILLSGKSGIGKSEIALDLVMSGHRLVADDIVEMRRESRSIIGVGPDIIKHHMEIRGLGILNIKDLFGISAVRDTKKVELVVELVEWDERDEYDRLGVDELTYSILDVDIPLVRLPVRPGRNMTSIVEVAARNQLLKVRGHYSARDFQDRLVRAIAEDRAKVHLEGDVE